MNKDEILQEIKQRRVKTSLKLPRDIDIAEYNGVISVSMNAASVVKNMQNNSSAFEGWILGLKAIFSDWAFRLDWVEPENRENGHYQRFLYRVSKFDELFGDGIKNGWFSVAGGRSFEHWRKEWRNKVHILNCPSCEPQDRMNESDTSPENYLENELVKKQPRSLLSLFNLQKGSLFRQLPMGLFNGQVSKDKAIFTGGKSAADLWGVSTDGSLVLFELKAENNNQVGVISELFFYSMVLLDEQRGHFTRECGAGKMIRGTKSLQAMVLASGIHPLIESDVFGLLNDNKMGVRFGYVKITSESPYSFEKVF